MLAGERCKRAEIDRSRAAEVPGEVQDGSVPDTFATTLLDGVGLGIVLIDQAGEVAFVNQWVRQRWQGQRPIGEGAGMKELLAGSRTRRLLTAIRLCLEQQQSSLLSHYLNRTLLPLGPPGRTDTNRELSQNIAIRPFVDARRGNRRYCLLEITDVSVEVERERKLRGKAAELAKANHELERFTYAASHDLKAPLRALAVLPDWIEEDLVNAEVELPELVTGHLKDMRCQSQRLERLLSDLLDYCRIGWNSASPEPVSLRKLVADTVELIAWPREFTVRISGDWPKLRVVTVEMSLVLRNLLANALKHHDDASGTVQIIGKVNDGMLTIDVIDDGPGIPQEYHDRVFEMFRTLKPRDQVEGSGVGLALVRRIIDRWQGSIELISPWANDRGTCFRVSFPTVELKLSSDAKYVAAE